MFNVATMSKAVAVHNKVLKTTLLGSLLLCFSVASYGADGVDTPKGKINSIVTRDTGVTSIYLSVRIPDTGCDLTDRVVIDKNDSGAQTLFDTALKAVETGKPVVVRVFSCADINPPSTDSAPKVVKIQLFSN